MHEIIDLLPQLIDVIGCTNFADLCNDLAYEAAGHSDICLIKDEYLIEAAYRIINSQEIMK